jgi:hypothetical protein
MAVNRSATSVRTFAFVAPALARRASLRDRGGVNDPGAIHPLASQMAELLTGSDADELQDVVDRWVAEAPTPRSRASYEALGTRLLELKQALAAAPAQPTRGELELALSMMLALAGQAGARVP